MTEGIKPPTTTLGKAGVKLTYTPDETAQISTITNADGTCTQTDGIGVFIFSTGNTNRTLNLPAVANSVGREIWIIKSDTGTGSVTLTNSDGSLVGACNTLYTRGSGMKIVCANGVWYTVRTPTSSGSTATTLTFDGSGGTSSSVTVYYRRMLDMVHLFIPAVTATSGTSSTVLTSNTALPAWASPLTTTQSCAYMPVYNNGANLAGEGIITITTGGIINIYKDCTTTANWTNSSTCGTGAGTVIQYYVGTGS